MKIKILKPGRLDQVLASAKPDYPRSFWTKEIKAGHILLDGRRPSKAGVLVEPGSDLSWIPAKEMSALKPKVGVIFEDDNLLVINKPAGVVSFSKDFNLAEKLAPSGKHYFLVHRLDKDTSGVMLIAKNETTLKKLQAEFKERKVTKVYLAIVMGVPAKKEFEIVMPLKRDTVSRQRFVAHKAGRPAQTQIEVVDHHGKISLIKARPLTGRTHQIRVHLKFAGYPIVGDTLYGTVSDILPRQALHAYSLTLKVGKTEQTFKADMPADFKEALKALSLKLHD
jgi:23S rRNA pseudouridine1911/1915/1917 synthase